MTYFKLFLLWLGFMVTTSVFGEYIISREVNGFLQLLCFVGLLGVLIYLTNETIKTFIKNKEK
jgi:hypothetical protein